MATSYDPIHLAFHKVMRDFKDKLDNDQLYTEILKTTSIEQVYDVTDKLQEEQASSGHLRHLSKIQQYLERLRDYTGAIDTFVQAKPDVLALIWGPIKLLIQWASTLKQSFDAIIDTTAEIGELLPEFKEVATIFGDNEQLNDVLVLFFQDILDFYLVALKFFSMTRWRYFFESLWPRQRDKIKVVLDHIGRHTLLMRKEVRLEHIREEHDTRLRAIKHFEKMEKSIRQQEFHTIKTGISPIFYDDRLNWFHDRVCQGTGRWLMRDSTFIKWLDFKDTSTKVLWLQGIPGSGKTYLAGTAIDKAMTTGRTIFAFLSHIFSSSTTALSILHSLIFQLVSDDIDLQAAFCQSSRDKLKTDVSVATTLLATLLNCAGPVYIVIDGVDEIDETERKSLLRQLVHLTETCVETRLLISSRPEADLAAILDPISCAIRVDNYNAGSIQAFVTRSTQEWLQGCNFDLEGRSEIQSLLAPLAAKAKGMFLYAKVVLSSIELLSDIREIRQELSVLPENLDAAYGRVFQRIDNLKPTAARETARNLLGWVGCSPTPLTLQELEQALLVIVDPESGPRTSSTPNIIRLCGPIVEVVDDSVRFVHFTVKEYICSPHIGSFIDYKEATLSLAKCCILYLCQDHHDVWIEDEEMSANILSGAYQLHNYAATTWLELVERYFRLNEVKLPSEKLISALDSLASERTRPGYDDNPELAGQVTLPDLKDFKLQQPDLYKMLCNAAHFRQKCSSSEYHVNEGHKWTSLDPLVTSDISIMLYEHFNKLLCPGSRHLDICTCQVIERYYGQRPFLCGFLGCPFRRHGFAKKSLRDSHTRHHERSWKCSVEGCEYAETGFLSRRMRDEHLDFCHQDDRPQAVVSLDPDEDEFQPLMFDLVLSDNIEAVKVLLSRFMKLETVVQKELRKVAAFSGSAAMLQMITKDVLFLSYSHRDIVLASIQGQNIDTLRLILSRIPMNPEENVILGSSWERVLGALIESSSLELFQECEEHLITFVDTKIPRHAPPALGSISSTIIKVTARCASREQILLSFWKKLHKIPASGFNNTAYLGAALGVVAQTTFSVNLAQALIDYGAPVDARRSDLYLTPLHHAARRSTPEAAELIKFLLYHGADPELNSGRASRKISEEKGAKEIQKWLGISWDELVRKANEDRKSGTNSDTVQRQL